MRVENEKSDRNRKSERDRKKNIQCTESYKSNQINKYANINAKNAGKKKRKESRERGFAKGKVGSLKLELVDEQAISAKHECQLFK